MVVITLQTSIDLQRQYEGNQTLTAAQLTALDANHDGQLSGTETSTLKLWNDLNESGLLDSGELSNVAAPVKQTDYSFLTQGNGLMGSGAPTDISNLQLVQPSHTSASAVVQPVRANLIQFIPDSNYRALRDTDNVYYCSNGGWIIWSASQIKINYNNRTFASRR